MNTTDYMKNAIDKYFEDARTFRETEQVVFVAVSGISGFDIRRAFPALRWHALRREWLLKRLRKAMAVVHSTARRREEFTLSKILALSGTGVSHRTISLYIRSEWHPLYLGLPSGKQLVLNRLKELVAANTPYREVTVVRLKQDTGVNPPDRIWLAGPLRKAQQQLKKAQTVSDKAISKAATAFLNRAKTYEATKRSNFVSSINISAVRITKIFPQPEWERLRREWLVKHLRSSMRKIYKSSKTQQDFTISRIVRDCKSPYVLTCRLLGDEWRAQAKTLPSSGDIKRERVLATLKVLVENNISLKELTYKRLFKEAGTHVITEPWIAAPLRAARAELAARQRETTSSQELTGTKLREVPGGYIDLDNDVWDFNIGIGLVARGDLRGDVADVCWQLLKDELTARVLNLSTVYTHFYAYKRVGDLLGSEVPDIKFATLEAVQRAWATFPHKKSASKMKWALTKIFLGLYVCAEQNPPFASRSDVLKIISWLSGSVKTPAPKSSKDFLNERELHDVIIACLRDIEAGFEYLASKPDLLTISPSRNVAINASPVANLTTALIILIMTFTGLRRGSVMRLEVNSAFSIRPDLNAFIWSHPKIQEEKIVITPDMIARLVEFYVACTDEIRQSLNTKRIFVFSGARLDWSATPYDDRLNVLMNDFVLRHNLNREESPLALNAMILRRTYATHQLHEGRSIWFVRAQLGHKDVKTTAAYTQKDRFEHPRLVAGALNKWGREVVDLWHKPIDLTKGAVMLRQDTFAGALPAHDLQEAPCSTCGHLITGDDFLHEWEDERLRREELLHELEGDPKSAGLLVQEREKYAEFMQNYHKVGGGETHA